MRQVTSHAQDEWDTEEWEAELVARELRGTRSRVTHTDGCFSGRDFAYRCGGVFRCHSCRRLFGWCYGQGCGGACDDRCCECAARLHCEQCEKTAA